jgi:hypothetical protein
MKESHFWLSILHLKLEQLLQKAAEKIQHKTGASPEIVTDILVKTILFTTAILAAVIGIYYQPSQKTIKIADKFVHIQNGRSQYMLVTTTGEYLRVSDSFWHWKWESMELWREIRIRQTYRADIYGMRVPWLGMFPRLVSCVYVRQPHCNK